MSLLALLAAAPSTPVDPLVPVTATAPTADDGANIITIPTVTGVLYQIDGATVTGVVDVGDVATTITVNAVASAGYVLTGTTSWAFAFTGAAVLTPLYPGATPEAVPAPLAEWDFRESSAPYYTTAATGNDLPLYPQTTKTAIPPVPLDHEIGRALHLYGDQWLAVPAENIGRLNMGANGKTQVSMAAWVYVIKPNQVCFGGIWGETFDPPTRQYALFGDLPSYGGDDMACFHISKDGQATPGVAYSTDYSANPDTFTLGKWELHVGTYDGEKIVSYLDGVAYEHHSSTATTREKDGWRNPYNFLEGLNATPEVFHVGSIADGTSNLHGMIRRLRVWDVALTPGQVLTLAAEHPTRLDPPAPEVGWTFTDQSHISSAEKGGNFLSHTWTVDVGEAAADRVVLIGLAFRGQFSSMPTLTGLTINGSGTFLVAGGQDGLALCYATVPTGDTVEVAATWSGTAVADANVTAIVLDGADPTHAAFGVAARGHYPVPATERGGAIITFARTNSNIVANWFPGQTVHYASGNSDDGIGVTCGVHTATGLMTPVGVTQGSLGIGIGRIAVVAFDPASPA